MTGVLNMLVASRGLLRFTTTPGNSGSAWGYRSSGPVFGALSPTAFLNLIVTDIYSDAGNDLIVTFNGPVPLFNRLSLSDSFGGTKTATRASGSIVGSSIIWVAGSLGGPVYASPTPRSWTAFL